MVGGARQTASSPDDWSRPWGRRKAHLEKRSLTSELQSRLQYSAFVLWRDTGDLLRGSAESSDVRKQKDKYTLVVDKIHDAFGGLRRACFEYAKGAKVEIDGLDDRKRREFVEMWTVQENFRWIRGMLAKCDQNAEAHLRMLKDAHSKTRNNFATDWEAVDAVVRAYLTTGTCRRDQVPPTDDGDNERNDIANELWRHLAFRRFHALVRNDVDKLADELGDETTAKTYNYWDRPRQGEIELVLQATRMAFMTNILIKTLTERLHSLCGGLGGLKPYDTLETKARILLKKDDTLY